MLYPDSVTKSPVPGACSVDAAIQISSPGRYPAMSDREMSGWGNAMAMPMLAQAALPSTQVISPGSTAMASSDVIVFGVSQM